ncbi:hypothetical protein P3T37_003695 [Kitasatospora sp. MAA4]|uniref:hypothetical protein n=1 Tax=Kitasatospora sp. MAA4 TaxID=3035093 RepID=UPI0024762818|nr:hypothetical protein [Kitasatospora sp. MAA4]MDH6134293.1 hypothetical protein [Kitasatospora sp. MAA4]
MRVPYRRLRRRCEAVLQAFGPIPSFSVETVCTRLSALRGRPLHLLPLPEGAAAAGACGLWLATDAQDYIFFEQQTSRPHQEHIVLHEIGHMLFDHPGLELLDGLLPSDRLGSPELARRLLARTDYTTRQEQEAEMLASLIRTVATEPGHGPDESGEWEAALGLSRVR